MSSVERSFRVLELLTASPRPLTHGELARELDIPKSTLTQLLAILLRAGFIGIEGRSYLPGVRLLALAQRVANSIDIRSAAKPIMEHLAIESGETVALATYAGDHVIYIEQAPSPQPIRYVTVIGTPRPLHCTAAGRLFLAFQGPDASKLGELQAFTPKTVTDPGELDRLLEQIRADGYAVNVDESVEGVAAVAVPIFRGSALPSASLSVCGPTHRVRDSLTTEILDQLRRAVRKIEVS